MEPRLRAALMQLALSAPDKGMQAEIAAYVQTGGGSPLSPRTFGYVQTQLRPMGLSVSPPGGATGNITPPPAPPGQPAAPMAPAAGQPDYPAQSGIGNLNSGGGIDNTNPVTGAARADVGNNSIDVNVANLGAGGYQEPTARRESPPLGGAAGAGAAGGGGGAQPPASAPATANAPASTGVAPVDANNPFTAGQEIATAGADDTMLAQLALKAMGLDLGRPGLFGKAIARFLLPLLQARRAAYGFQGGGSGQQGMTGLTQDILNFAKGATQPGGNFFQAAQQYGQGVANNPEFQQYLSQLTEPEQQQAALRSLQPLLYAGANPMVAQAIADATARQQLAYQTQSFQGLNPASGVAPPSGIYGEFLGQQQQQEPFIQRLFGRSFR